MRLVLPLEVHIIHKEVIFPPRVLVFSVWMANKMIAQNSLDDAIAAMERLVEIYGDTGGEFLFRCALFDWSSQGEGKRLSVCIR